MLKFELFSVLEIAKDSGRLRQYETHLIKLCASSGLFIPPTEIKVGQLIIALLLLCYYPVKM